MTSPKRKSNFNAGGPRISCDDIVRFYETRPASRRQALNQRLRADQWTLTSDCGGLVDSVIVSDFSRSAAKIGCIGTSWIESETFRSVSKLNPYHRDEIRPFMVSMRAINSTFNLGSGHLIQKIQRLFGLPIDPVPRGSIAVCDDGKRNSRTTIIVHFTRESLIDGTELAIVGFMNNHSRSINFIEIGSEHIFPGFTRHHCATNPLDVVNAVSKCDAFIGVPSGPYHVASALGVKTITVIDSPEPWEVMLPVVGCIDVSGADHLYPQSAVLHQRNGSAHWPKLNIASLEMALDGRVFPYDSPEKYLELVAPEKP